MKKKNWTLMGAVLVLSVLQTQAAIVVGTGADESHFVLESPNIGLREYEVRFDFDPLNPIGTSDLLNIIDQADSLITFSISNFGTPAQANEFLNSITFNGVTETNDFSPGASSWAQWLAGGEAGSAGLGMPDPQPLAEDSWTFGSGLSSPFRVVEPGSNDALVFGPANTLPSVDPIPEPSGSVLLLLASLSGCFLRKRQS